ncbi:MAG: hypothetical protein LBP56_00405 [Odoribacteraceae bacterium]|jgi:hypothetical protein|nr:hypothetical protein [Odoribacteraceae bacterium]
MKSHTRHLISFFNALILISLPFVYGMSDGIFFREKTVCCAIILIFAGLTIVVATSLFSRREASGLHFTIIDALVGLYLLYGVINLIWVKKLQVDPFAWCRWVAMAGGYVLYRADVHKRGLLPAIAWSGVLQSVIAIGQATGVLEGNHSLFTVTGSFRNPGQLGGYLAVTGTVAWYLLINGKRDRRGQWARDFSIFAITLVGLILADSRAGGLAACGGIAFCHARSIVGWIR